MPGQRAEDSDFTPAVATAVTSAVTVDVTPDVDHHERGADDTRPDDEHLPAAPRGRAEQYRVGNGRSG